MKVTRNSSETAKFSITGQKRIEEIAGQEGLSGVAGFEKLDKITSVGSCDLLS
jgi:replicative DNA helicase